MSQNILTDTPPTQSGTGPYVVGAEFTFHKAGTVHAMRFYRAPGAAETTRSLRIYDTAGLLLGQAVPTVETPVAGWVTAALVTPVEVTASLSVVACYDAATAFRSDDGNIVEMVDPTSATWTMGRYGNPLGSFPSGVGNTNYGVDLMWSEESAAPSKGSIARARDTVAGALAGLGIPVHTYPPGTFTPPAVIVDWGNPVLELTTSARAVVGLDVRIITSAAAGPAAAERLDALVDAALPALQAAGGIRVDPPGSPTTTEDGRTHTATIPVHVGVER